MSYLPCLFRESREIVKGWGVAVCVLLAASILAGPASAQEIVFQGTGSSFAAILGVEAGATIEWTFADATTSNSATPTKDYGTAAVRENRLKVTPWSALTAINIGYDGGDGGPNTIPFLDQQNVVAVTGLENVAPYLELWCSSCNPITSLDFSNFVSLTEIECFLCQSLTTVDLHNTPLLSRACFEDCALTALDLSESPSLADLRGALNNYTSITWGTTGADVWHICVRDNPQMTTNLPDMSQFPVLSELFVWNDNQTGTLHPTSTSLTSVMAFGNQYTAADFSGCFPAGRNGEVYVYGNALASLDISNCPGLARLYAQGNNLDQSAIDGILETLDSFGTSGGVVDLTANAAPSSAGVAHALSLIGRSWTVNVEGGVEVNDPPVITYLVSSSSTTTASIMWTTNKAATSALEYGTTTAYGDTLTSDAMTRYHFVPVEGLTAGTTYHFRVSSEDSLTNVTTSADHTFTTRASGAVYWEDDFHRANGDVGNGWAGVNGGAGQIVDNVLRRVDVNNYRILYNPTSVNLPTDYYVTMTVPHTTIGRAWWGLMGRYVPPGSGMGTGNKVFWRNLGPLQMGAGHAEFDNDLTVTQTGGYPASWSRNWIHTVTLGYSGNTVTVYLDGQEFGYFTDDTNNMTGTGIACVGDGRDVVYDILDMKVTDYLPTLDYDDQFQFTSLPQGGWMEEGQRLELSVGVEGAFGNVTYQWSKDGEPLSGAAEDTYVVETLTLSDQGTYVCMVADEAKAQHQTPAVYILVYPVGGLPLLGLIGLVILGAIVAVVGAVVLRRRRRAKSEECAVKSEEGKEG